MTLVYLGLGANLGDAHQTLKDAVVCLAQQHDITVLARSGMYRTAPLDAPGADFHNCVVKLDTRLTARALLALCLRIEHHFGRERPFRHAPRTLDIDILLYGDETIDEPDLSVPHPQLCARAFTLVPLAEIDAHLVIPRHGAVSALLPGVADQRIALVKAACPCFFGPGVAGRNGGAANAAGTIGIADAADTAGAADVADATGTAARLMPTNATNAAGAIDVADATDTVGTIDTTHAVDTARLANAPAPASAENPANPAKGKCR